MGSIQIVAPTDDGWSARDKEIFAPNHNGRREEIATDDGRIKETRELGAYVASPHPCYNFGSPDQVSKRLSSDFLRGRLLSQ